jgi:hypothetical protein
VNAFRERSKKYQKLQQTYQALKQKQLETGIEIAADYEAEDVIQAAAAGPYNMHHNRHGQPMPARNGSGGSGGSSGRRQTINAWPSQAQNTRLYTARKYYLLYHKHPKTKKA